MERRAPAKHERGEADPAAAMRVGAGGGPISLRNLRTFGSLRNPVFRLYFGSVAFQMGAMSMQMLALSLLLYRLTGSATILGMLALANSVPLLFFSLFGGILADRVQKKWVILAGSLCYATVSLAVAVALAAGLLSADRPSSWLVLLVYSLVTGTIMGVMWPANQAVVAEIVPEDQLMNAVAINTSAMNFNRLVMPAMAGFLVEAFDFAAVYFFMTGMFLLAALCIWLMPLTGTIAIKGGGALAEVKDGIRYVRGEPTILMVLAITLVSVLLSMPYMTLLPIFTEDILSVGASGMGMLISVSGVGALSGSLVLASLPNKRRGLLLLLGCLVLGLALAGFSFSSQWQLALIMMAFVGLGQAVRMTLGNTLLQFYVEDEYRGRVMSLYMMEFGITSFSVFFAGAMADVIGIQWSVGGLAMLLAAMALLTLAFVPRMRRLD